MLFNRESGLLLHPSSLPGSYGIGDLGPSVSRWVEVLAQSQQRLWQILPLTPAGDGFSPYQARSSYAGDVLLLSLELLFREGYLDPFDADILDTARSPEGPVDVAYLLLHKLPLLRHAAAQFLVKMSGEVKDRFDEFRHNQSYWLADYARFQAVRRLHQGAPWFEWPRALRLREKPALAEVDRNLSTAIRLEEALQFLFSEQWGAVRAAAHARGIRIIGDLPIFVAHDSADVWAAQELFQLNPDGSPRVVAGVPPDYFSKSGQRWGNPLYAWERHEVEQFAWWTARVRRTLEMCDLLRIDHFRGFAAYWEIPAEEPTAVRGRWVRAPGDALFRRLQSVFGKTLPIIAEDLGLITKDVEELRDRFQLPGMRVLQFSFGGEEKLLPHRYPENCVAYTGTHDNDTIVGWYTGDPGKQSVLSVEDVERERDRLRRYFSTDGTDIHWTCMKHLLEGKPAAVIFPLQDLMGLGSEARMNVPGTVGPHNWTWRFRWSQLHDRMLEGLRFLTQAAGRNQTRVQSGTEPGGAFSSSESLPA